MLGCVYNPVAEINAAPAFAQTGNEVLLTNFAAAAARKTEKHVTQRFSLLFICMHAA